MKKTLQLRSSFLAGIVLLAILNFCLLTLTTVPFCTNAQAAEPASTPTPGLLEHQELQAALEAWMSGDIKNCERLIRIASEREPNLAPPPILLALLYSNAEKYAKMRDYLEQATIEYPDDPESYLQLAGIALQDRRLVEAELLLERAETIYKKFAEKSEKDGVKNDTRRQSLLRDLLSNRANLANLRENVADAEKYIRKLIGNSQNDDDALSSLGFLLFKQDRFEDSEKEFEKAYKINSKRLPGWIVVAHLLENSGKTQLSQKLVDSRMENNLIPVENLAPIVRLLMKWNRMKEAGQYTIRLQREVPNLISTWLVSGELALYGSQFRPAEDLFRRAILMEANNPEANNGLALALADQNNKTKLKQALEIAKTNWNRNPGSRDYSVTYAWLLFLTGDQKESDSFFAPLLESGKVTQSIAYYLAEIANVRGDTSLALNLLDIALEQKTNFPKRIAAEQLRKLLDKDSPKDASSNTESNTASQPENQTEKKIKTVSKSESQKSESTEKNNETADKSRK